MPKTDALAGHTSSDLMLPEEDTVSQTFTCKIEGREQKIVVTHYWRIDTLLRPQDDDLRVQYVLEGDTVHYLSYTTVRMPGGNALLYRGLYARQLKNADVYMLQHTRIVGYAQGALWLEQTLGLPGGTPWSAVYVGVDVRGKIVATGASALCDGGVQLNRAGTHLLSCKGELNLLTQKTKPHKAGEVAIARYLNDTLLLVVEDNAQQRGANATMYHTQTGETLFSFLYQGYVLQDGYTSGMQLLDNKLYCIDPKSDEVLVFDLKDVTEPKQYDLHKLKEYATLRSSIPHVRYQMGEYEEAALYLDSQGAPVGYTLN